MLNKARKRLGIAGAIVLGLLLALGSIDTFYRGLLHHGRGLIQVGGCDYADNCMDERLELVSQDEFRSNSYEGSIVLALMAFVFLNGSIRAWLHRDEMERIWKRISADQSRVEDLKANPEHYREDLREWLRKERLI